MGRADSASPRSGRAVSERSLSVHLVDDVVSESRRSRQAFLVLLLLAGGVGLYFSMEAFLADYFENPYMVTMKILQTDEFPPLTYCPGFSADLGKLEKNGLTMDHYLNLMGFFWLYHDVAANLGSAGHKSKTSQITEEAELYLAVNNLTVLDAVIQLSVTADDIISTHMHGRGKDTAESVQPWFTGYGLCFLVDFGIRDMGEYEASYTTASLKVAQMQHPEKDSGFFPRTDYLFVGERIRVNFPTPAYRIPGGGFRASVHIHVTQVRRHKGCVEISYEDHHQCLTECIDRSCAAANECSVNSGIGYANLTNHSCNGMRGGMCYSYNNRSTTSECSVECPRACSEKFHTLSIFPLPTEKMNTTNLEFSYVGALSAYSLEERYIYTWHGFIAGFGGQLSLWSGMSILSIPQILLYVWDHMVDWCGKGTWGRIRGTIGW